MEEKATRAMNYRRETLAMLGQAEIAVPLGLEQALVFQPGGNRVRPLAVLVHVGVRARRVRARAW